MADYAPPTTVPAPSDNLSGDAAGIAAAQGLGISAPPVISATTGLPSPIGVPEGYAPPQGHRVGNISIGGGAPQEIWNTEFGFEKHVDAKGLPDPYRDGDQYAIPLAVPESVPELQMKLVALGFLDPHDVTAGRWDDNSAQAFSSVLAFANRTGMTVDGAMQYLIEQAQKNGTYGKVKSTKAPQALANPEDLRASYKNAAEQLTGGDLSKGEEDRYLAYYRSQENAAYNAQPGTQYTQPMSSEAYIRSQHPQQVDAYNSASRLIEWYRMLGVIG